MGFAAVALAGAGAAAVEREILAAGAPRAGGATGVVAMTRISGSLVALELPLKLEASCAATVLGAIASTTQSAQSNPRNLARMTFLSCAFALSHPNGIVVLLIHVTVVTPPMTPTVNGSHEDGFLRPPRFNYGITLEERVATKAVASRYR